MASYAANFTSVSPVETGLFSAMERVFSEQQLKSIFDVTSTRNYRRLKFGTKIAGKNLKIVSNIAFYSAIAQFLNLSFNGSSAPFQDMQVKTICAQLLSSIASEGNDEAGKYMLYALAAHKAVKIILKTFKCLSQRYGNYLKVKHKTPGKRSHDLQALFLGKIQDRRQLIKEMLSKVYLFATPFIIMGAFGNPKAMALPLKWSCRLADRAVSALKCLRGITMVATGADKKLRELEERKDISLVQDPEQRDVMRSKLEKKLKKQQFFYAKAVLHLFRLGLILLGTKILNPFISIASATVSLQKKVKAEKVKPIKDKKVKPVQFTFDIKAMVNIVMSVAALALTLYIVYGTKERFDICKNHFN